MFVRMCLRVVCVLVGVGVCEVGRGKGEENGVKWFAMKIHITLWLHAPVVVGQDMEEL